MLRTQSPRPSWKAFDQATLAESEPIAASPTTATSRMICKRIISPSLMPYLKGRACDDYLRNLPNRWWATPAFAKRSAPIETGPMLTVLVVLLQLPFRPPMGSALHLRQQPTHS